MSTFKFADYSVEAGADEGERSAVWLICPECPGTRSYFADEIETRVSIGELFDLATEHHNTHHREPHLEGNGQ